MNNSSEHVCVCVLLTETKKKSLAVALRKKFGRSKDSGRAQSAERITKRNNTKLLQLPAPLENAASTSRIPGSYRVQASI